MAMLRQHRDLDDEIKAEIPGRITIVVLDLVVLELERLARSATAATATWARASLVFLSQRKYLIAEHKPGPSDVDASLIGYAITEKIPTAIATIDRELKRALDSLGIRSILPRTRHGLVAAAFRF
jgi:rRNA-processing protein FCF1